MIDQLFNLSSDRVNRHVCIVKNLKQRPLPVFGLTEGSHNKFSNTLVVWNRDITTYSVSIIPYEHIVKISRPMPSISVLRLWTWTANEMGYLRHATKWNKDGDMSYDSYEMLWAWRRKFRWCRSSLVRHVGLWQSIEDQNQMARCKRLALYIQSSSTEAFCDTYLNKDPR